MDRVPLLVVPDPDDPGCAQVMVQGTISGRPYLFVLDTGAAVTHVVADEHTSALPVLGRRASSGVFAAKQNPLVELKDVRVGPMRSQSMPAVLVQPGTTTTPNLLGMDLLKGYSCHFLFDQHALAVQTTTTAGGALQPWEMDAAGHPYLSVHWPGVTAVAVWDSGASITVVDQRFADTHPHLFTPQGASTGTDATGAQRESATATMAPAQIGGHLFTGHTVAVVDLSGPNATLDRPMDLLLGYTTLRQANWLLDFPSHRWAITQLHT